MRTMTRSTVQYDVTDRLSYLLIGGGALAMVLAVVAALTI